MNYDELKTTIILLALLLLIPIILLVLTWLFPVFLLPNQETARHFIFNPPTRKVDRPYDRMTELEKGSMRDGGARERLLEAMKNQPSEVPYEHVYLGTLGESDCNTLGWLTIFAFVGWLGFAGFRAYQIVLTYLDMQRLAAEKKKKSLPLDVRRLDDRRRRR
ncbi:MAG TPA: hypothetical protein PKD72_01150 [Gemmatales bacterium]|nr:hypothetical protein [Gemmatales bacterium]